MREKKKTLMELIETGAEIFPSEVDTATQNTIIEWYQFRYVTDNDRAPVYIRRVLSRDYSRYRELLRIEAGKAGDTGKKTAFDWLVTDYLERYERRQSDRTTSATSTDTTSTTSTGNNTTAHSGADTTTTATQGTFTAGQTVTNTGETTATGTQNGKNYTGNDTAVRAGALSRTQPMSAEYTADNLNANDNRRGYITRKSEGYNVGEKSYDDDTDTESSYIVGLHRNFPELNIKNPTSASDSYTNTGVISESTDENTHTDTTNDTSTTRHTGTDTTDSNTTATTTHGEEITTESTGTETGARESATDGTEKGEDISETQHTGRGGEIAVILSRAQDYIRQSSAFEWLRGQLESCFIANLDYE